MKRPIEELSLEICVVVLKKTDCLIFFPKVFSFKCLASFSPPPPLASGIN